MALTNEQFNQLKATLINKKNTGQELPSEEKFGWGFGTSKMTGQEFLDQPKIKQYAQAFVATLPKDVYDFFIRNPEKFARSVAEVPQTVATLGKNVPDYGGTISDANKVLRGGAKPFGWEAFGAPSLETAATGLSAAQVGNLAVKGIQKGIPLVQKGLSGTGAGFKGAGEGLYKATISTEPSTVDAMIKYDKAQPTLIQRLFGAKSVGTKPITEANTAVRQGLAGTEYQLGVQAERAGDKIYKTIIQPKLAPVKNAVNMRTFISELEKDIKKVPGLSERNNLLNGLAKFKEDYGKVGTISAEKLQQYKADWAKFLPDSVYKGKPIANALKAVNDLAASKARNIIYKIVGEEGKQAYFDYGNLKSITEAGKKSVLGNVNQKTGFRLAWQTFMDKAVTPVATIGGKILYKTGEGLEFIGKSGAKKVSDIIK